MNNDNKEEGEKEGETVNVATGVFVYLDMVHPHLTCYD